MNQSQPQLERAADLLKILSNPVRLKLMLLLAKQGPSDCAHLQGQLDRSRSSVGRHLSKLKAYGAVTDQRQGSQVQYAVSDPLVEKLAKLLWSKVVPEPAITV